MIEKLKNLYTKYREMISYLFWGVMATVVNWVVYFPLEKLFHINYLVANVIAWIAAVVFAFFTNRVFVFRSERHGAKAVLIEFFSFVAARLFSFGCEELLMFLGGDVAHINTDVVKIAVAVIVVILNYVFSKLLIFRKDKAK